eukprot:59413_1
MDDHSFIDPNDHLPPIPMHNIVTSRSRDDSTATDLKDSIFLDIDLDAMGTDGTQPSSHDMHGEDCHSDNLTQFKHHVTTKRKATFCCIFSFSAFILSIMLILAPLRSSMWTDWVLYHTSTHTRCTLSSVTLTNDTINHTMDKHQYTASEPNQTMDKRFQCYYLYDTTGHHSLSDECGSTMHETASCGLQPVDRETPVECYIFDDKECHGTVLNVSTLKRNENMFVFLMCVGSVFGGITLLSCIYGIFLTTKSGVYCTLKAIQKDDDQLFRLMQEQQYNKKRHRKKDKKKKRKSKKKRKRRQLHEFEPNDDDFSSLFSSQFGIGSIASTIPSRSTVQSIVSCDLSD